MLGRRKRSEETLTVAPADLSPDHPWGPSITDLARPLQMADMVDDVFQRLPVPSVLVSLIESALYEFVGDD